MMAIAAIIISLGGAIYAFSLGEFILGVCFLVITGYQVLVFSMNKYIDTLLERIGLQDELLELIEDDLKRTLGRD